MFVSTLPNFPRHSLQLAHPGGEGGAAESILRIEKLLGTSVEFHELDLLDKPRLEKLFKTVRERMEDQEELNNDWNDSLRNWNQDKVQTC